MEFARKRGEIRKSMSERIQLKTEEENTRTKKVKSAFSLQGKGCKNE